MKRYKGYQFKQAVETLTRKIAKDFGKNIHSILWADVPTAGINRDGQIVFADVADDATLTDVDVQRYAGFAVHEMLHWKFTSFIINGQGRYERIMHNAVEDAWIEHSGISENLTGNIGGLLTALLDQMVGNALDEKINWADPKQYPFVFAVHLRRHANKLVPVANGLQPIIDQARVKVAQCTSSQDTLDLARWIIDQLQLLGQDKGQEKNKPDEGKTDGDGSGKQSGQPEGADGQGADGEGDEGQDADGEGGKGQEVGNATAPSSNDAREVEPTNEAPEGMAGAGSWDEQARLVDSERHLRASWIIHKPSVPAKLRFEVKRLFDDSGLDEFQKNRRSGSVNIHALHKLGLTDKLFQRRHAVDGIESAVVICLDISGSMFDDGKKMEEYKPAKVSERIVFAVMTCQALLETLAKAGVATAVVAFGSGASVVKPFEMHHQRANALLSGIYDGGGTNDYFAVRYAHKMLMNRPEQRKICFVITDGQGNSQGTRDQIKVGERLGITTIGIGIQLSLSMTYDQSVTVNKPSDLGIVSFKQIKLAAA